jgi:hypothetical protein
MTDQERAQVLKMIEDGKISPEEGLRLLQTLEQNPADEEGGSAAPRTGQLPAPEVMDEKPRRDPDPEIKRVAEKGRRLWYIPLAAGILLTVLGGFIMYWNIHPTGFSAWFYCLGLPVLLLGVAVTALSAASRTSRWIFLHVEQKPGEHPQRIVLGFPLPLRLTAWFLRVFRNRIPNLEKTSADELLMALEETTSTDAPLVVNVDEGDDGEKVQVYIG